MKGYVSNTSVFMAIEKIFSILQSVAEYGEIDSNILDPMLGEKVHKRFEEAYEET